MALTIVHTKEETMNCGLYLAKTLAPFYEVKRLFGAYYLYHKKNGFVVVAPTQRSMRNAMRNYSAGRRTNLLDGRE